QRPIGVRPLPRAAAHRVGVPDHQERPRVEPPGIVCVDRRVELLTVPSVGQPFPRPARLEPRDLVYLVLELTGATAHRPGPVAHLLQLRPPIALAEAVPRRRQRGAETDLQTRLLQRLPRGRRGPLLAALQLALRP